MKISILLILALSLILASVAHASTSDFFNDLENFKIKNLNLKSEDQKLKYSSDFLLSKKLFWTPELSVSVDQSQTRINSIKASEGNSFNADLSLNLFRAGADWNLLESAKAQNKAQDLQVLNESLRVEINGSDLIFKSIYLLETERIQEQLLKLKEEALKIVTDRYRQGKLPLQDVTKSEVDLIQQKNKLRTAYLDLLENKSQIASLFMEELKTSIWPFSEEANPKVLDTNNFSAMPLVEQKFWISKYREESWKASKSVHWPSLDFRLQYREAHFSSLPSRLSH